MAVVDQVAVSGVAKSRRETSKLLAKVASTMATGAVTVDVAAAVEASEAEATAALASPAVDEEATEDVATHMPRSSNVLISSQIACDYERIFCEESKRLCGWISF